MRYGLLALLALVSVSGLQAHGVHAVVEPGATSVVVLIQFSDGSPFAYEQYEIFGPGDSVPFMNGRSDARGRIPFSPDRSGNWKVRYFSQDGHGGELIIPYEQTVGVEQTANADPNRILRLTSGLGYLLGLFGLGLYMMERRKARAGSAPSTSGR